MIANRGVYEFQPWDLRWRGKPRSHQACGWLDWSTACRMRLVGVGLGEGKTLDILEKGGGEGGGWDMLLWK